jgi:tetratricopeptide (TPR) repeat protein
MGRGDLAIYEGRLKDAVSLLERGAASDLAQKNTLRAADKLTALAYAHLAQGQPKLTIATASHALDVNTSTKTRFLAARLLIEAGEAQRVQPIIVDLANELNPEPQAYAKILEGDAALQDGRTRDAVKALTEANQLVDSWIGHFDLGRAYLAAGAYLEADAEFDACLKRKGEALSIGLDAAPTAAYLPSLYYYLGRVREAQNIEGYADFYRTYLEIRGAAGEDSLLPDVRRRLA